MERQFDLVEDLTSDVMFKAYGKSEEELLENSARALFSIMCETNEVSNAKKIEIEVEGESLKDLLYDWLTRILGESEINGLFFIDAKCQIEDNKMKATLFGDTADPAYGKVHVKAITMYKFNIKEDRDGFEATVSCDI